MFSRGAPWFKTLYQLLRGKKGKKKKKAQHPGFKPTTSWVLLPRRVLYRCATAAAHYFPIRCNYKFGSCFDSSASSSSWTFTSATSRSSTSSSGTWPRRKTRRRSSPRSCALTSASAESSSPPSSTPSGDRLDWNLFFYLKSFTQKWQLWDEEEVLFSYLHCVKDSAGNCGTIKM